MDNFGALKAALLAEIGREPSAIVYELVNADINRELRTAEMKSETTLTGTTGIDIPSGFLGALRVYIDGSPPRTLQPTSITGLDRNYCTGGRPTEYAIEHGKMYLNPVPSTDETVTVTYYARKSVFTDDTDTNAVLDKHPGVYFYGCLMHHSIMKQDAEKAALWKAAYDDCVRNANSVDNKARFSGSPINIVGMISE
ncbi:MAG: phage adaptor protein [Pikeienuella sp.]